jgi:hypothetical protein
MGVSGQRHAPAVLYPRGKDLRYPLNRRLGGAPEPVWTQGLEEKSSAPVGDRTPIIQLVVRHYTAWATAAPCLKVQKWIMLGHIGFDLVLVRHEDPFTCGPTWTFT